ncbi:MAG: prepilin-type N-terminal cleavage/methylation domain-containing protein [Sedimentisphaerales bacterium]|nr:prepilin-type N-terminal cleavage/methylation domain-containing protein [Sedimentisphaerales bacterium]
MRAKQGFTLVEILIVVVILGILAAIVIPQFTQASTEAKTNSLCSDLQTLRSQIELYKVQHNDDAPVAADFIEQMVYCTDIDGNRAASPSKVRTTTYCYGPYLERVPINPFNDKTDATYDNQGSIDTTGTAGDNVASWEYDASSGEIWADDDFDADGDGTGGDHADL